MPEPTKPRNRGPAAAEANRLALIAAGRRLFAARGYDVPLSAIAREAGVGQGVLYRHFPDRLTLALAVFSQNIAALERLADTERGDDAFGVLMAHLLGSVVESAAFVDAVVHAREIPEFDGAARVNALLDEPLARAKLAGLVRADLTVPDAVLLVRLAYGAVVTHPEPDSARAAVLRAVALVDADLAASIEGRWS